MKHLFTFFLMTTLFVNLTFAEKTLTILLVHDDEDASSTTESIREAIAAAGYVYVDYDAVVNGVPELTVLESYELVIWNTGKNYPASRFWDKSNPEDIKAFADMISYLDNGGMLWLSGLNVLYDGSGSAPQTFTAGDFIYDYLGVESYAIQDDLYEMEVTADNGICTVDNVTWTWSYDNILYVDHAVPTSAATSVYTSSTHIDTSVMVYNEKGDAKVLTDLIRWDAFITDDPGVRDDVITEILDYFNQFSTATIVDVTSIEITSESDFAITENNGTLQLGVTVMPENATNKTVAWSIKDGSVPAFINQNGVLTASGVNTGNGTVTVVATANDGTGITDEAEITISNQLLGDGFKILLVNADQRDFTKYMDVDTALLAGGYNYKVLDAATLDEIPSYSYLSNFQFVIWFEGRDGVDIMLWDVSDSTDVKAVAPLKQYMDQGGSVWVQGRDMFYDIWKGYSDENTDGDSIIQGFESGSFVYDYLGIKSYVAQSHLNETSGTYDGCEQLDITEDNDFMTLDPVQWQYTSAYYLDILEATSAATPLYYLGPETYDFSLYYAMILNTKGEANIITSGFNPSDIDTQENLNQMVQEVCDYMIEVVGIQDDELIPDRLDLYPNPANNSITLKTNANEALQVAIYDLTGKLIVSENLNAIQANKGYSMNVSNLADGLYNLVVYGNSNSSTQKLLIVH